jgi:nucleotide-binding universal stress UspA family protein
MRFAVSRGHPTLAAVNESAEPQPIVVGYDGSEQSNDALALGAALADATGARLLLAGAYGPEDIVRHEVLDARRAEVRERLVAVAESLPRDASLQVQQRAVRGSSVAAALQALAEAEDPRALVLGSCHRGAVGRVLIGGVADRLLHGAPCPVIVAPRGLAERGPVEIGVVCVGFDGSSEGWAALQRAAQIAAAAGARLRIALAVPPLTGMPMPVFPPEVVKEHLEAAQIELDRARQSVSRRLEPEARLLRGDPAQQLAGEAGHGVDLLVVGSRGYGPLRRVLLGSVSAALMHAAPCPVMVVPRSAEFQPSGDGMAAEDEVMASR